jgi:hypothetical protein
MLLGQIDSESLDQFDDRTLEALSVQENVRRILNTRAGALKHLPDYGLPDLTNVYKELPGSSHALKADGGNATEVRAAHPCDRHRNPGERQSGLSGELRDDVSFEAVGAGAVRYVFRAARDFQTGAAGAGREVSPGGCRFGGRYFCNVSGSSTGPESSEHSNPFSSDSRACCP